MTYPYDPKAPVTPYDPDEKKVRSTAWLRESTHGLVRSYAHHRNKGVSEIIEEAVCDWIERTARHSMRGYNTKTDEFIEVQAGEWFPPLPRDTEIRRGRRRKE